MNEAQSRIATFEEGLQRLEETANFEQPDLAQLTQIKEQLEVERKVCFCSDLGISIDSKSVDQVSTNQTWLF